MQRAFASAGTAKPMIDTLVDFVAGHTVKETVEGQAVAVFRIPRRMDVFGTLCRSAALLDGKRMLVSLPMESGL